MKTIVQSILNKLGYRLSRITPIGRRPNTPYLDISLESTRVVDLESLAGMSLSLPGMISPDSGRILYALCYMQEVEGDVVEIGSWQGRSTSFIGRAVKHSGNGKLYAIDHFGGNTGKERHYIVKERDLSDLKDAFVSNMKQLGLHDTVNLLNMRSEQAARELADTPIRFLFIDGDHSYEGVMKDIELFFPKLVDGALVVFDDFSRQAPGVIAAVDSLLNRTRFSRVMSYENTIVVKFKIGPQDHRVSRKKSEFKKETDQVSVLKPEGHRLKPAGFS